MAVLLHGCSTCGSFVVLGACGLSLALSSSGRLWDVVACPDQPLCAPGQPSAPVQAGLRDFADDSAALLARQTLTLAALALLGFVGAQLARALPECWGFLCDC